MVTRFISLRQGKNEQARELLFEVATARPELHEAAYSLGLLLAEMKQYTEAAVYLEKAARGKTPTDVWWHTIVPTRSREKTGYPTQKPLGVLERIVKIHSNPGDLVLDCFAGSGTLGEAAARLDRDFILIDNHKEAVKIMARRLAFAKPERVNF